MRDGGPGKESATTTQRLISVLALALAAALLLAACTDDDGSTATAPPPASTSCADEVPRDVQVSPFVCLDWPHAGATIEGDAIAVAGYSAGAFEGGLVIEVLDGGGDELALVPIIVSAPDVGFVGPFAVTLRFDDVPAAGEGRVHVYAESPVDGSNEFEETVAVRFGSAEPDGGESCAAGEPRGVQVSEPFVCIDLPVAGALVRGSIAVTGHSAGAFEQSIVVELLDSNGAALVTQPTTVAAPDLGMVGPWAETLVLLNVDALPRSGTGVVHVYAEDARDGSIAFEDAVEVRFEP
jgi:hypothetical protein